MPERFTETLRAASEAGWSHAVQHRFVNKLKYLRSNLIHGVRELPVQID